MNLIRSSPAGRTYQCSHYTDLYAAVRRSNIHAGVEVMERGEPRKGGGHRESTDWDGSGKTPGEHLHRVSKKQVLQQVQGAGNSEVHCMM